jgi:hypothetical protein
VNDFAGGRQKFFERQCGQSVKCPDFKDAFRLQQFYQSGEQPVVFSRPYSGEIMAIGIDASTEVR